MYIDRERPVMMYLCHVLFMKNMCCIKLNPYHSPNKVVYLSISFVYLSLANTSSVHTEHIHLNVQWPKWESKHCGYINQIEHGLMVSSSFDQGTCMAIPNDSLYTMN